MSGPHVTLAVQDARGVNEVCSAGKRGVHKLRLDESCVFFVGPPAFGVVSCLQDLGYCYYQRLVTT